MVITKVSRELIVLGLLNAGQSAVIETVHGEPAQVQRLHELGFLSGVRVKMIQPGQPCIISLKGQRLGFRATDLMSVLVRPEA